MLETFKRTLMQLQDGKQDWLMCFHRDKYNILSVTQKQNPSQYTDKLHDHSLEKKTTTHPQNT